MSVPRGTINGLNIKQRTFVREFLIDFNAKRSAIAAGYSEKCAEVQGSRLLSNPKVAAEISKHHGKRLEKLDITADRVLQELAKMAFVDPRKFYRNDGSLKHPTELDDETAAALAGMDIEESFEHFGKGQAKAIGLIKKIKIADKGQNLERLGRHLKLFTDKVEHGADSSLALAISSARKRAGIKQ